MTVPIACYVCLWFHEFDDEEIKEAKKHGEDDFYWCYWDNIPVPTHPERYCSRFKCICGGDIEDGEHHLDCVEVELE